MMREELLKIVYWAPETAPEGERKPPARDRIDAAKNVVMTDLALLSAEITNGMYKKPVGEIAKQFQYAPLPGDVRMAVIAAWTPGGVLPIAAIEKMVSRIRISCARGCYGLRIIERLQIGVAQMILQYVDYKGFPRHGGCGSDTPSRYFYLIVKSQSPDATINQDDIQKFVGSAVDSQRGYFFSLLDIATDQRLKDDLLRMTNGAAFFDQLLASVPAFLITYDAIPILKSADKIELYPISNYNNDVQIIYEHMGFARPAVRRGAIVMLEGLNKYIQLKPNIFGLGVNLNEVISDLIVRIRGSSP
jgi:hypothetical protein